MTRFATGFVHPIATLFLAEGSLLIADFGDIGGTRTNGVIYRIVKA